MSFEEKGKILERRQCPRCTEQGGDTSGDNLCVYEKEDGTQDAYCFACGNWMKIDDSIQELNLLDVAIEDLPSITLVDRNIEKAIAEKYKVKSRIQNGKEIKRYYPLTKDGVIVGYKIRELPKSFSKTGETGTDLFGQRAFPAGGRIVIVTAGEEDALAAHKMTKMFSPTKEGYASVSLSHGVGDTKTLKNNLEWLESFEKVVFALDQDEKESAKATEYCELLSPGKAFIAKFELHDASDMCVAGKHKEFYNAVWKAEPYAPTGIVEQEDIWEEYLKKDMYETLPYPREWGMDGKTYGIDRPGMVTITAGTALGKSTVLKHLMMHVFKETKDNMGVISMEESIIRNVGVLMGMELNKRIILPDVISTVEEQRQAFDKLFKEGRFVFCTGKGIRTAEDLFRKIRFMAKARDCKYIFLDHITAIVNKCSIGGKVTKNDFTEFVINALNDLCHELGVSLIMVSHVRKTTEDSVSSYERGKVPNEDSMFGSSSIKQYSDGIIAISRNKDEEGSPLFLHVLKDRLAGSGGKSFPLYFDGVTGWLKPYNEENSVV